MFSLSPHQPAETENYDGCPVVRLTDSSDELAHLLRATMYANYAEDSQLMSCDAMSAILRLSTPPSILSNF
ncbi:hypothetical protein M422DRAFT_250134 [Sphaerobolus stellatus SS14]|nr:hypothetical protein M422DRAFT_250134 [Sphaerobolus stellatus SS14]